MSQDKGVNEILRRVKSGKFKIPDTLSVDARSLIGLLLQLDPENRVSAQDILKHSFMTQTVSSRASVFTLKKYLSCLDYYSPFIRLSTSASTVIALSSNLSGS